MKVKVHVKGLRELDKALKDLDLDIRKKASRDAGRHAMEPIKRRMEALVPVDEGGLKESIRLTSTNAPRSLRKEAKGAFLRTSISVGRTKRTEKGGYQALQVEFGTSETPAQPFVRPAIRGRERTVFARFKHGLKSAIEKGLKKQTRRNKRKL
jgi:HK97 gp10 family phage protein